MTETVATATPTQTAADNPMAAYGIDPARGMQIGMYTLGDHLPDPVTGIHVSAQERIHEFIDYAMAAEQAGLDSFSLGESHQEYFASQAHAVVLGAIAQATGTIRIGSTSTILSTSDPVRVFENFATLDLISNGRAELVAGRASRVGLFELLGYDLRNYEELFDEKFGLLQLINDNERVTWQGQFRKPLRDAEVLPRPLNGRLPLWRAVGGAPGSAIAAGLDGVPMVMAHLAGAASQFKATVDAYRAAARHAGHNPDLLPIATAGQMYIGDTTQEALRELYPRVNEGTKKSNGQGMPKQLFAQGADPHSILNVGSVQQVIEKILHQHEVFGHQRYLAQIDFGGMPREKVMRQIELLGTEVAPAVRKYTALAPTSAPTNAPAGVRAVEKQDEGAHR